MGNRVEDGNRAKNWVVQTSSIRGPVFIFAQRMPPSPSLSLSGFLRFRLARCFFFHIHCPRLPSFLRNLEKIIFFRSRCPWFLFIRGGRWPLTCFFFSPSSSSSFAERGFCLFVERKRGSLSDGLAFYSIVLMKVSLSIRHLFVASLCFSSQRIATKLAKNSSTFTFQPFSFISITFIPSRSVTRCMKERIF